MTEVLKRTCPERFTPRHGDPYICYRCDCNSGYCYKVMRYRTVQKPSKTRFQCPAHNNASAKHSQYVQAFADTLERLDGNLRVIWDWACVPGNAHMSIDATVLCGWRCANFEIDGPVHFCDRQCIRSNSDAAKEELLLCNGWGLMRLHYMDVKVWGKYVKHHVMGAASCVLCTESYKQYFMGDHLSPRILRADQL